jgi:hypothetical protein
MKRLGLLLLVMGLAGRALTPQNGERATPGDLSPDLLCDEAVREARRLGARAR